MIKKYIINANLVHIYIQLLLCHTNTHVRIHKYTNSHKGMCTHVAHIIHTGYWIHTIYHYRHCDGVSTLTRTRKQNTSTHTHTQTRTVLHACHVCRGDIILSPLQAAAIWVFSLSDSVSGGPVLRLLARTEWETGLMRSLASNSTRVSAHFEQFIFNWSQI